MTQEIKKPPVKPQACYSAKSPNAQSYVNKISKERLLPVVQENRKGKPKNSLEQ